MARPGGPTLKGEKNKTRRPLTRLSHPIEYPNDLRQFLGRVWDRHCASGSWYIRPSRSGGAVDKAVIRGENLKEIVRIRLHNCGHCGGCAPGRTAVIPGKEFRHICCSSRLESRDPGAAARRCVKRPADFTRNVIARGC